MDEVQNAKVETHRIIEVDIFGGGFLRSIGFDAERDVPRAGRLLFQRDFLDCLVVWEIAMESNWYLVGFALEFLER